MTPPTLIADRELPRDDAEWAERLQHEGLTLSEIAAHMGVERGRVVASLYTAKVEQRPAPTPILIEHTRVRAG